MTAADYHRDLAAVHERHGAHDLARRNRALADLFDHMRRVAAEIRELTADDLRKPQAAP